MCISARNWDLSTSIVSQGLLLNGCPGVRAMDEDGIVLCEHERQDSLARLLLSPSFRHPGAESASIRGVLTQALQIWRKSNVSMLFPKFRSIEREMYPHISTKIPPNSPFAHHRPFLWDSYLYTKADGPSFCYLPKSMKSGSFNVMTWVKLGFAFTRGS